MYTSVGVALLCLSAFSGLVWSSCTSDLCLNGGLCRQNGSDRACVCQEGFQGQYCGEKLQDHASGSEPEREDKFQTIWLENEGIPWDMVLAYILGIGSVTFVLIVIILATWKVKRDEERFKNWIVTGTDTSQTIPPSPKTSGLPLLFTLPKRGKVFPITAEFDHSYSADKPLLTPTVASDRFIHSDEASTNSDFENVLSSQNWTTRSSTKAPSSSCDTAGGIHLPRPKRGRVSPMLTETDKSFDFDKLPSSQSVADESTYLSESPTSGFNDDNSSKDQSNENDTNRAETIMGKKRGFAFPALLSRSRGKVAPIVESEKSLSLENTESRYPTIDESIFNSNTQSLDSAADNNQEHVIEGSDNTSEATKATTSGFSVPVPLTRSKKGKVAPMPRESEVFYDAEPPIRAPPPVIDETSLPLRDESNALPEAETDPSEYSSSKADGQALHSDVKNIPADSESTHSTAQPIHPDTPIINSDHSNSKLDAMCTHTSAEVIHSENPIINSDDLDTKSTPEYVHPHDPITPSDARSIHSPSGSIKSNNQIMDADVQSIVSYNQSFESDDESIHSDAGPFSVNSGDLNNMKSPTSAWH